MLWGKRSQMSEFVFYILKVCGMHYGYSVPITVYSGGAIYSQIIKIIKITKRSENCNLGINSPTNKQ